MYNNPYGGWSYPPPSQPVVFIPPQPQSPGEDPLAAVSRQITMLEAIKKSLKEEKKEEKKDDNKKDGPDLKVVNMMFLMLLLSPITGSVMFKFFQWGASLVQLTPH